MLSIQAEARRLLVADRGLVMGEIELGDAIRQRMEFQERKRQVNIVTVVDQAALELGDSGVPAVEPDHDWTARFKACRLRTCRFCGGVCWRARSENLD